jgi:hypothetical protein
MPTEFTISQAAVEEGVFAVTVSFTDEDGNPVTPNSGLKWSLTKADRETIVNAREDIVIASPGTSVTIVLQGADLSVEDDEDPSWRYLVIEGTYDSTLGSNLPLKDHLRFPVVDIAKVPG